MARTHHFHPELRHATVPTYLVSYGFPLLLSLYEIFRLVDWVSRRGFSLYGFNQMGYDFTIMLAFFALQIITQSIFLISTVAGSRPDVGHRVANLGMGLLCSAAVLMFDLLLQARA
ncbi:hypothetical protein [Paraburkholderia oxyphila]|uniref:hypothetical protein n=1 Tax=Paraburkholderia oxyphila TaxID=614212 RepID=UPI000488697D|nr:hypothetical protein [Paraburkholderia oxyphila]